MFRSMDRYSTKQVVGLLVLMIIGGLIAMVAIGYGAILASQLMGLDEDRFFLLPLTLYVIGIFIAIIHLIVRFDHLKFSSPDDLTSTKPWAIFDFLGAIMLFIMPIHFIVTSGPRLDDPLMPLGIGSIIFIAATGPIRILKTAVNLHQVFRD